MLEFEGNRNEMHEFSSLQDLIIQERLLAADDDISAKEILNSQIRKTRCHKNGVVNSDINPVSSKVLNNNGNKVNNAHKLFKEFHATSLCGWYVDPAVVYRKNTGPSKSKGALSKENTVSRDLKNKSNSSNDFIFRHYSDTKLYIEQYRQEHACCDVSSSSATKTDLQEPRRLHVGNECQPLVVCSEINTSQQTAALLSSSQEGSAVNNIKQQYQVYQKPLQQCVSGQYISKQDQQRQTNRARNIKKLYSLSSTAEICKAANILEKSHATDHSERVSSAKAAVLPKVANDAFAGKSELTATKTPTSKIVHSKEVTTLLGPGSPLCPDNRGNDTFAYSSGSGSDKESSGVQATKDISSTRLELCSHVNEQASKPEPSQLFMIRKHGEDWHRTPKIPDFNKTVQVIQPMHVSNSKSDALEKDIIASSFHENTAERSIFGNGEMSEQKLSRQERSLLTVTGQDCCKTKKYVYDRWTVAKKQDEKSIMSHKRRIQHIIEQSKLKYKFRQNPNMLKPRSGRRFLDINRIQITDPFVQAVPCNSQIRNMDNSERNIYNGLCSSFTEDTVGSNSIQGNTIGVNPRINIIQKEITASCEKMPDSLILGELEGFDCSTKTNFKRSPCKKNCCKSEAGKAGLFELDQSLFRDNHRVRDKVNTKYEQKMRDKSLENGFENCLPRNNQLKISKDNCYIHKLAEDVSTMVTFSMPKIKCPKCPLVSRAQSEF